MSARWAEVQVTEVRAEIDHSRPMGSRLPVTATVRLGGLPTADVLVEIYHGPLDPQRRHRPGRDDDHAPVRPAVGRHC